MAKAVRHLREGQAEFQKVFAKLCNTKSSWQAWSDFVEMAAISIANSCEIRCKVKQEREERYMSIIGQYSKGEQALFPELLEILVASLERNSEQDFLGEMFMALELGSHWKGQFFTPYNICKMMAKVNTADAKDKLAAKGWIGVHDPACGAGATLIGVRNALELDSIGGTQVFFVGQDIDRTAAMMCYIQLSLLGCAGYVVIADTLIHPITGPMLWPNLTEYQDAWFMPLNFLEPAWVVRLSQAWRGIDVKNETSCRKKLADSQKDAKRAQMKAVAKHPEATAEKQQMPLLPIKDANDGQLTLF